MTREFQRDKSLHTPLLRRDLIRLHSSILIRADRGPKVPARAGELGLTDIMFELVIENYRSP
jgi:hypothetical protein